MAIEKLTIAVLGAGNIGGTLGPKWAAAGHQVVFGIRDPNGTNAQTVRSKLGSKAVIGTVEKALSHNPEVVVLAVPGTEVDALLSTSAQHLDGRIILDATNRMGGATMNSFAALRESVPNALPFRAFNIYNWINFEQPQFAQGNASLFFCGPGGDARSKVEQLITDVGLEPVYIGGIEQVSVVDGVTQLWFALAVGQKRGMRLALKLLTS